MDSDAQTQSSSSRASSRASKKSSLSLDLSAVPAFTMPTPPSNTLIFTNLQSLDVFRPDNLQTIRDLVSATAPVHTWAPLKSFRRIIVSFFSDDAAIAVRAVWDGEAILGERCRVYFGQPTPINGPDAADVHLALPDAGKLFFISPPPSPPNGWEMRNEDPPNKMVHAEDLADALAKLRHQAGPPIDTRIGPPGEATLSPLSPADSNTGGAAPGSRQRSRSSTLIFHPEAHGSDPHLPRVTVDDMTDDLEDTTAGFVLAPPAPAPSASPRPIMTHTARPPMELAHQSEA